MVLKKRQGRDFESQFSVKTNNFTDWFEFTVHTKLCIINSVFTNFWMIYDVMITKICCNEEIEFLVDK